MITAIIQARVNSTRFPNKIFAPLSGKPLIWHVVDRLKWSKRIEKIILATTVNPADDSLTQWANDQNMAFFRGSEEDVLSRFFHCASEFGATCIVRITADDPFKDPVVIDRVIDMLKVYSLDFGYNNHPPSFPEGLDTEVFLYRALEKAHKEAVDPFEREHVTQYLYRHPKLFKQKNLFSEQDISSLRWTIDTNKDYEMAQIVYNELYQDGKIFLTKDILNLFKEKKDIPKINAEVRRSALYSNEG